jgi:hypothetical protein
MFAEMPLDNRTVYKFAASPLSPAQPLEAPPGETRLNVSSRLAVL